MGSRLLAEAQWDVGFSDPRPAIRHDLRLAIASG